MDLRVGDVVMLKSGGPKMTVAAVKQDRAFCVWFNQRDEFHEEKTAELLIDTLKLLTVRAAPQVRASDALVQPEAPAERVQSAQAAE